MKWFGPRSLLAIPVPCHSIAILRPPASSSFSSSSSFLVSCISLGSGRTSRLARVWLTLRGKPKRRSTRPHFACSWLKRRIPHALPLLNLCPSLCIRGQSGCFGLLWHLAGIRLLYHNRLSPFPGPAAVRLSYLQSGSPQDSRAGPPPPKPHLLVGLASHRGLSRQRLALCHLG